MPYALTDPFESMLPGTIGPPPGWFINIDFGSETFAFTDPLGGMFPLSGSPGHYHWFRMHGGALNTPDLSISALQNFTLFFGMRIPGFQGNARLLQVNCIDALGVGVGLFTLDIEGDMTISANGGAAVTIFTQYPQIVGKTLLDNSGVTLVHPPRFNFSFDTWYYLRLDLGIASRHGDLIKIGGDLIVEGTEILSWTQTEINVNSDAFPLSTAALSTISFEGPGFIDLSQIYVSGPALDWPFPIPTVKIRESQGTIEIAQRPTSSVVRNSQNVIELASLPSSSHVRISQMVIELPPGTGTRTLGWQVKEA